MNILFWLALTVTTLSCFRIFWNLSDFSQLLNIRFFPRSTFMDTWYKRKVLKWLSLCSSALAIWVNYSVAIISMPILLVILSLCFVLYYAGIINPKFMMPSKQHDAHFVGLSEASKKVRPNSEVMVIVNNGHARAHPDFEMWRPHIAGDKSGLGGENIIMTYCSLSNLGMAYRPIIDGKEVDLKVATQLENNLLMWDTHTGEPVQQLYGKRECSLNTEQPSMQEFPSFKMTFKEFCKAYPEGEVMVEKRSSFWKNPIAGVHNLVMDMLFYFHIAKQRNNDEFLFDTIKHHDNRLQCKTNVFGLNVGDDYVCYSEQYIKEHGILNILVGNKPIVLHYNQEYNSIGAWYKINQSEVTELDFFGISNLGKLQRVETMKAGIFYGVWFNFFPQTAVNR